MTAESAASARRFRLGTILLLVTIAAGAFLRFDGIGKYGFWTDELFHVFAAESYLKDGSFDVPWDPREYTRALPVTLLTALSFKLLGQSEASARVLFALVNVLFIVMAYRILKKMFSRNVALIFALASSFSTIGIQMSQECRMYTLFQLFYFLMSIAVFWGLEYDGSATSPPRPGIFRNLQLRNGMSFKFFIAAAGLGLAASSLQKLTFNFALVVLAYCITMFLYQGLSRGFGEALVSKYAAIVILMPIVALFFALIQGDFVGSLLRVATDLPGWNRSAQSNLSFYKRVLTDSHPILWAIYPLGAFLAIHRYGKRGLFFVMSFVVLFAMHSFVFARTSERYIFNLLPFFVTVAAVGVNGLLSATLALAPALPGWRRRLFYVAVAVSLCLVVYPRIHNTVLDSSVPKFSNWKDLDPALVRAVTRGASITTDRLRFNYYFKQYPNFVIDASDVDHVGGERVIINLAEFKKALARHPNLHLVTYGAHIYNAAFVSPEVKEFVLRELDRVDKEEDGRIMVFRGRADDAG
ncbi:MAG: glycosyltransferase family 39 protein [Acidobacteriota bacterium]|nr:glycosyltransferase family 39 protein [Acidobacteriota bacterium]